MFNASYFKAKIKTRASEVTCKLDFMRKRITSDFQRKMSISFRAADLKHKFIENCLNNMDTLVQILKILKTPESVASPHQLRRRETKMACKKNEVHKK